MRFFTTSGPPANFPIALHLAFAQCNSILCRVLRDFSLPRVHLCILKVGDPLYLCLHKSRMALNQTMLIR